MERSRRRHRSALAGWRRAQRSPTSFTVSVSNRSVGLLPEQVRDQPSLPKLSHGVELQATSECFGRLALSAAKPNERHGFRFKSKCWASPGTSPGSAQPTEAVPQASSECFGRLALSAAKPNSFTASASTRRWKTPPAAHRKRACTRAALRRARHRPPAPEIRPTCPTVSAAAARAPSSGRRR